MLDFSKICRGGGTGSGLGNSKRGCVELFRSPCGAIFSLNDCDIDGASNFRGGDCDLRGDFGGTGGVEVASRAFSERLLFSFLLGLRLRFFAISDESVPWTGRSLVVSRVAGVLASFSCNLAAFFFLLLNGQKAMPSGGGYSRLSSPLTRRLPRLQHKSEGDSLKSHELKRSWDDENDTVWELRWAIDGRV